MDEIQRMGELAAAAAAEVRRTTTSYETVVDQWVQVLCDLRDAIADPSLSPIRRRRLQASYQDLFDGLGELSAMCDPFAATQRSVIDQGGGDQP
jgi:hypothetical protein